MSKKVSRIISAIMIIAAVIFILYALNHPEAGFPWSIGITYTIYAVYACAVIFLMIAPFKKK